MLGYVYILKSVKNNRFYIGSTNNISRRLLEHNSQKSKYTSESGPWNLVFTQEFDSLTTARKIEYWLKRQKDKELISKVINDGIIRKIL